MKSVKYKLYDTDFKEYDLDILEIWNDKRCIVSLIVDDIARKEAKGLCDLLNQQDEEITILKRTLYDLNKKITYMVDNEKCYGDEYTSIVLQDIIDEFKLNTLVEEEFL